MAKGTRVTLAWTVAISLFALPIVAAAAGATFKNPVQAESISALLSALLQFFVRVATVVCVLYIVWSGFLFVKAQGNEEELKKAKQAFFYALIGTLLMLGAQVISTAISNTINQIGGTSARR